MVDVMVADAAAATLAVTAAGGEIVRPVDPDGQEVFVWFRDPAGNVLGIYQQPGLAETEELSRLAAVARTRPVIFASWAFCMGRKSLADAAREVAAAGELAEAIGARAWAAFAAKRTA